MKSYLPTDHLIVTHSHPLSFMIIWISVGVVIIPPTHITIHQSILSPPKFFQGGFDEDGDVEDLGEHCHRPCPSAHWDLRHTGWLILVLYLKRRIFHDQERDKYKEKIKYKDKDKRYWWTSIAGQASHRAQGHQDKECSYSRRRHLCYCRLWSRCHSYSGRF